MKTRKQIIDEILQKNDRMPATERAANLEFALMGLQDGMLFQLAADLKISLEPIKPSVVLS